MQDEKDAPRWSFFAVCLRSLILFARFSLSCMSFLQLLVLLFVIHGFPVLLAATMLVALPLSSAHSCSSCTSPFAFHCPLSSIFCASSSTQPTPILMFVIIIPSLIVVIHLISSILIIITASVLSSFAPTHPCSHFRITASRITPSTQHTYRRSFTSLPHCFTLHTHPFHTYTKPSLHHPRHTTQRTSISAH